MLDEAMGDIAIEEIVKKDFGLSVAVRQVVAREIPVSHTAEATVFLTPKHQLFVLINAESALTLGDVRKLVKKMGLEAEGYLPPVHDKDYFNVVAREKFRTVFPGRHSIDESELRYYRLLAPYNPALVRINAVTDGVIRQFDSHHSSGWRVAIKFAYRQIRAV
ncbi:hypothetical protein EOL73_03930 [Candidatus Saccharibacteria bacterium]|nr:hypothetical protein [Candidatus Saccharibacteria bacterium]NCU40878.1 hypothetical protein [Candidatus Saccharibacteria bacterium]